MKRRDFIKASSAVVMLSQFPYAKELMKFKQSGSTSTVYEVEDATTVKLKLLFDELGGLKNLLKVEIPQATVLIKPNLCLSHLSDKAATTSVDVIELLCKTLIEQGIKKIIIADHTLGKTSDFDSHEINMLSKNYSEVKIVYANEERMYEQKEINGKVLKSTEVLKLISRADLFINFAQAKHHIATHVSLAVKNLMGCIWNRSEFHSKMDLHQAIGDLATIIRPTLNIIDATRVLLTGGPTGPGMIQKDNRLFASKDIAAVDSVVLSRYNFGNKNLLPNEVPHLVAVCNNGVGENNTEKILVKKI
jgi:uncharacterized protein (DUF362 family)